MTGAETVWLALIWLPVFVALAARVMGVSPDVTLTLLGVAGLVGTWVIASMAMRRRAVLGGEVDLEIEALWSTLAIDSPRPRLVHDAEPLAALSETLPTIRAALVSKLAGLKIDAGNLRSVLDTVDSPLLVTTAGGEVALANRAAVEFFKARSGPVIGAAFEDLFAQAEVLGVHASALAGKPMTAQVRTPRPDGARVHQVLGYPVPWQSVVAGGGGPGLETGALILLRDVTELAIAVQLKTDFVANASHELRTPLASIRAAVETLADGAADDPAMREKLIGMITSNAGRLEEMVRDLLDLSRLESPEAPVRSEVFSASEISESLREIFEGVCAERKLGLAFELDAALETLVTDPKVLHLVLKNLIDNATKFAYEGSTIRVVGEHVPPEAPGKRGAARFKVMDKGLGIPFGHQQRIFERFFQVDPARSGQAKRRGTGLGLAIVKHAVKSLGGSVRVDSVWKEGTTMTVELPGVVGSAADAEAGAGAGLPPEQGSGG